MPAMCTVASSVHWWPRLTAAWRRATANSCCRAVVRPTRSSRLRDARDLRMPPALLPSATQRCLDLIEGSWTWLAVSRPLSSRGCPQSANASGAQTFWCLQCECCTFWCTNFLVSKHSAYSASVGCSCAFRLCLVGGLMSAEVRCRLQSCTCWSVALAASTQTHAHRHTPLHLPTPRAAHSRHTAGNMSSNM